MPIHHNKPIAPFANLAVNYWWWRDAVAEEQPAHPWRGSRVRGRESAIPRVRPLLRPIGFARQPRRVVEHQPVAHHPVRVRIVGVVRERGDGPGPDHRHVPQRHDARRQCAPAARDAIGCPHPQRVLYAECAVLHRERASAVGRPDVSDFARRGNAALHAVEIGPSDHRRRRDVVPEKESRVAFVDIGVPVGAVDLRPAVKDQMVRAVAVVTELADVPQNRVADRRVRAIERVDRAPGEVVPDRPT